MFSAWQRKRSCRMSVSVCACPTCERGQLQRADGMRHALGLVDHGAQRQVQQAVLRARIIVSGMRTNHATETSQPAKARFTSRAGSGRLIRVRSSAIPKLFSNRNDVRDRPQARRDQCTHGEPQVRESTHVITHKTKREQTRKGAHARRKANARHTRPAQSRQN